jgi:two-component system chemotaxis response regulator CheY
MTKVLVVDDAGFMRNALKLLLEKNGFIVCGEAENGKIAIEKYEELKPDIVTMDITMPEKTGLEALQDIMKKDPNAKIIMVSALGQESFVRESVLAGAKGFIVKPFKEEAILKALEKFKVG